MTSQIRSPTTGQSKVISGLNTKQFVLSFEVAPPPNAPAGLPPAKTTMDSWMAPTLPGYEEVTQVGMKMASKMAELSPGASPMAMFRPDIAKTAGAMAQELSKMKGIPVYETLTMGGFAPQLPNVGEAAKDAAKDAGRDAAVQGRSWSHPPPVGSVALSADWAGRRKNPSRPRNSRNLCYSRPR